MQELAGAETGQALGRMQIHSVDMSAIVSNTLHLTPNLLDCCHGLHALSAHETLEHAFDIGQVRIADPGVYPNEKGVVHHGVGVL